MSASAISWDIKEYTQRCIFFREDPVMRKGEPDCYGDHADKLKKKYAKEHPERIIHY